MGKGKAGKDKAKEEQGKRLNPWRHRYENESSYAG